MADYRSTLNLPRTTFAMRAGLPVEEPKRLRAWQAEDLYGRLLTERRDCPVFVLHDGPPYANGEIHMGTALNKVLKDIVNRYRLLAGDSVRYVPGYDTHGLPIEMQALRDLGVSQHQIDPVELRRVSAETASRFMATMTAQFERLGVMGDWAHPYVTMDPAFEAAEMRLFAEIVERELIYKDLKSVHWCPVCETALAEAELEYQTVTSPSIWVAFDLVRNPSGVVPANTRALVWTTTPWTIPANVAIAYHPELRYVVVEAGAFGRLIVGDDLVEQVAAALGTSLTRVSEPFWGASLFGVVARHPYLDRESPLVAGDHVTAEQGTGLVHTAPGHGQEDFLVGRQFDLPVVQPLDERGRFVAETPVVGGLFYEEANAPLIELLRASGHLLAASTLEHPYAHCWRSKNPVIFRATRQWFMRIEPLKADMLAAVDSVNWVPGWGQERMRNMIVDRQDWCISRQRSWGLPIPALFCTACGADVLDAGFVRTFADRVEHEGSTIWWTAPLDDLLGPGGLRCPVCGDARLERQWNVFDVWLDSGSTQAAVLAGREGLRWPADVVLEGGDQYRGWFNSLLTLGCATRGQAPYRTVVTNGWVLDAQGRPMHKSLGNAVDPFALIDKYGADVLRLWVAASDYRSDVRISAEHMDQVAEVYRKLRNTFRFCLGNLYDYPVPEGEPPVSGDPLDLWAAVSLADLLEELQSRYEAYEYHGVVQALQSFVTGALSSFYLDVIKDRLYTLAPDDPVRRGTQAMLFRLAGALSRVVAPILPFSADEMWEALPGRHGRVTSERWPEAPELPSDARARAHEVDGVLLVREPVLQALEALRRERIIGNSLEARLQIGASAETLALLTRTADRLPEWFMVAGVDLYASPALQVAAERAEGVSRCDRCWRSRPEAEVDATGLCARCRDALARIGA